jgi:invasion protein IalB
MTRTANTPKAIFALLAAMTMQMAGGLPAFAQDAAVAPEATTATYRDWTLRCDHLAETPPRKVCEVVQAVRAQDGQAVLAQIVLGRPAPDQPVKLIVQLPPGVWLPANVTLAAPSGETVTAIFTRCLQLCVADADTEPALTDALKAASEPARLIFQDGNRRPIELPISLDGFTAALAASAQ